MATNCIRCFSPMTGSKFCSRCGCNNADYAAKPHYLPVGTLLHGRYRLGMAMGEGGFGITYAGFDTSLDRRVAVKEFFPSGSVLREADKMTEVRCYPSLQQQDAFETGRQKCIQEARSIARLDDIGAIVRVLDFFEENNTAYIIMEFVEGETLKEYVKRLPETMTANRSIDLLLPVMEALRDMHARHFIHRDISPDNIMITPAGKAKLLDFGAVKSVTGANGSSTEHPIVKRGFSPIELYSTTGLIGPWSDVYAMCATIYYLLTGNTLKEPMDRMSDDGETVRNLALKVSPQLKAVLEKGLSIRPETRYQSMEGLIRDLEASRKISAPVNGNSEVTQTLYAANSPYASAEPSVSGQPAVQTEPVQVRYSPQTQPAQPTPVYYPPPNPARAAGTQGKGTK